MYVTAKYAAYYNVSHALGWRQLRTLCNTLSSRRLHDTCSKYYMISSTHLLEAPHVPQSSNSVIEPDTVVVYHTAKRNEKKSVPQDPCRTNLHDNDWIFRESIIRNNVHSIPSGNTRFDALHFSDKQMDKLSPRQATCAQHARHDHPTA